MKRTLHRALSMLVAAAMVLNTGLTTVFAQGATADAPEFNDSGERVEKRCICEPTLGADEAGHAVSCPLYTVKDSGTHVRAAGVSNQTELRDAVNAAGDGDTILLGGSFELTDEYLLIGGKAITLDLNGKTLTVGENSGIWVEETGALTLSDSGDGGKVVGATGVLIVNKGRLTMTDGTVESTLSIAIQNYGTLIVTGGEVRATMVSTAALENKDSGSITVGGDAKIFGEGVAIENGFDSTGTITVAGNAMVTGTNATEYCNAIANWGSGTVHIQGGTVQNVAGNSVVINGSTGTINVSSGEIIAHELESSLPAAAINNTSTGEINVTGGKLTAHGNGNGYVIRNDATSQGTGASNPAGEVNVTGGELVTTGEDSVTILSISGKLTVEENAIVRATGDGGTAIKNSGGAATVGGSAVVEATGGMLQSSNGALSPRAIFSDGTLMVGGNAQVRATGEGGMAVVNDGDFTLADRAILEATGNSAGQLLGGGALANFKTAAINGGIVRVTQPGGIAVFNLSELTINDGIIGRVELYGSTAVTYVYGRATPSSEPTGVPVLIGDGSYRIKVTSPSVREIASMRSNVTLDGATLPDMDDPFGFFELELQSSTGGAVGIFPAGMKLLLPFPLGTDDESNNYKVAHFKTGAANAPDTRDALGLVGGILCEPESLSPFMPVKFVRYQVTLDKNGGDYEFDKLGVKLNGKLDFEKYGLTELPDLLRSGYKFNGWYTEKSGGRKVMPNDTYMANATIYAQWSTSSQGDNSTGGGNHGGSTNDDANDFWMRVKDKINAAESGDAVKANAHAYDKMPVSVMDALRKNGGVTLVISWNGGKNITIPADKAQKPESGRVYYPLSLLAELYRDIAVVETPIGDKINPATGGAMTMGVPEATTLPAFCGGVWF